MNLALTSHAGEMRTWTIEIVTNGFMANPIELDAYSVVKIDHWTLLVDGKKWELPCGIIGLTFGSVWGLEVQKDEAFELQGSQKHQIDRH